MLYMADPTVARMEGFGIFIYSVECEFFGGYLSVIIKGNDTYYVRIKMMEFVPYVPMLPSWIIIPLVVCNPMAVI